MNIEHTTDENFADLVEKAPGTILLDVWAPWCGPCRLVGPAAEKVVAKSKAVERLVMANMEEFESTASRLNVRGTPTLILFRDGSEIARRTGAMMESQIATWIDQSL